MNHQPVHMGATAPTWLQHHLPWLGFFALVLGLFTFDGQIDFDPDERNG